MSEIRTEDMVINMGPQHPSTHGVLRLALTLNGEIVEDVVPHIGYLHRCFEKHCEAMTNYQQVVPYTDRMDYLTSMNNNFPWVLAIEKLLKIEVPERVAYIRVIMAELNRIASHLVAIGTYGNDIGATTPFLFCFRDREKILDLFEKTCGARLLYNYMRVGGLSHDLHKGFAEEARQFIKEFPPTIKELNGLLSYNKIFIERTARVGILPADVAINWGVTGPILRASGVKWDLRKNDTYSLYDRFQFDIPVGTDDVGVIGDCWNRYMLRMREMEESLKIIAQALDTLPEGDVKAAIPKRIRPNPGEVYVRTESPKGELGFYVVSDGSATPFRVKARAPSFCNLGALPEFSRGVMVADLIANLGSIDIVLGEVDR